MSNSLSQTQINRENIFERLNRDDLKQGSPTPGPGTGAGPEVIWYRPAVGHSERIYFSLWYYRSADTADWSADLNDTLKCPFCKQLNASCSMKLFLM